MNTNIFAITLFTDDLAGVRNFYPPVFGSQPIHSDDVSVVYKFGLVLINILEITDAQGLVAPAVATVAKAGPTGMLTLQVEDADAECDRLKALGVVINNGPVNQPWGIRAFTFADPTGQLWEFSQPLGQ